MPRDRYFAKRLNLMDRASSVLQTGEIDLVILNDAPTVLRYKIIESGKVIYCGDNKRRIKFHVDTINEYLDTRRMRDEFFYYLTKQIREGVTGFGNGYRSRKYQSLLRELKRLYRKIGPHK